MPRPTRQDTDAPSHDSFLDIVANMVGILIILVMVVGARVKNTPVVAAIPSEKGQLAARLQEELAIEKSLREDALKAARGIDNLDRESLLHGQRRDILAIATASLESEIANRRRQMDAAAQATFDVQRSLSESRAVLDELLRHRLQIESAPSEPTLVQSYPTPLSRTVNGREVHFQLRGGLIVRVPLNELVDEFKRQARRKTWKLIDQREISETLGPIDGFRLRYTLRRHDISPEEAMELGYGGSVIRLERVTFIPSSGRMGEPIDVALAERSEFRRILSSLHPGRNTITVWTYADSFGSFRRLKKDLYQLGYAVAARPLPMGTPISASPDGSKSAAE